MYLRGSIRLADDVMRLAVLCGLSPPPSLCQSEHPPQDSYFSYRSHDSRALSVDMVQLHASLGAALPLTNIVSTRGPMSGLAFV